MKTPYIESVIECENLSDREREKLAQMVRLWRKKLDNNRLRSCYYDAKEKLVNLGIAIPPQFEDVSTVIGWPAKAVDYLAARSIFDGFVYKGKELDAVERLIADNDLVLEYEQAVTSELTNCCVFGTVGKGGPDEPESVVNFYTTETATAIWNYRKKRIDWGLVITDLEFDEESGGVVPTSMMMHSDEFVYELSRNEAGKWRAKRIPHPMGRPLMVAMAYRPSIRRPFGISRISRSVISLTDRAIRTGLRAELGSEFYTVPQKYLLGASDDDFEKDRWDAYIGHIFMATRDEEGEVPKYGQLPQATMQPHVDYMRSLAAQFSGETNVPISSLGVIHDNPASAEAIYASKEDMVIDAGKLNRVNGKALTQIAKMAICIEQDKAYSELTDEEKAISPHFLNPAMPSIVSQADAMVKICAAAPWIAQTEVFLEEVGFDDATRKRLMSEKGVMEAKSMIASQMGDGADQREKSATMYEMQSIIKAYRAGSVSRANAITLFERINIGRDEAESILADASALVPDDGGES